MKIALIGFGGMGMAVKRIALERGHEVPLIIDSKANSNDENFLQTVGTEVSLFENIKNADLKDIDVVIDFSLADAVEENVKICSERGVNMVIGTTGWYEKMDQIKSIVEKNGNGVLWSSNFSIGVNLYFRIIEEASKMIDKFDEYDIWGHEIHHFNKKDSPSGTAKILEEILLKNIKRKTSLVDEKLDRKREDNEIHFSSVRGGAVNFAHTVGFDSSADRILITHEARCRDGYALGAVKAAEWLGEKKGFYGMDDFLKF